MPVMHIGAGSGGPLVQALTIGGDEVAPPERELLPRRLVVIRAFEPAVLDGHLGQVLALREPDVDLRPPRWQAPAGPLEHHAIPRFPDQDPPDLDHSAVVEALDHPIGGLALERQRSGRVTGHPEAEITAPPERGFPGEDLEGRRGIDGHECGDANRVAHGRLRSRGGTVVARSFRDSPPGSAQRGRHAR